MNFKRLLGRLATALPAAVLTSALAGGSGTALAQAQGQPQPLTPETCRQCHEATYSTYMASKHSMKRDARTPANRGECLTCHANAEEHVKAGGGRGAGGIVNPGGKTVPAQTKNAVCITCHNGDANRMHWQSSTHALQDVACTNCHQIHAEHDRVRDKRTQPQVCFECHKEQRTQISKPFHHPIVEGKMGCSDCHNVHSNNPKQLVKDTVVEVCYTCHMEKRGPFVHNHQPVTEDCTICHQPHGTTIASMLKARPPFLCQDCHASGGHPSQAAALPTGRTTSTSLLGTAARGCLNCHTNIHGSNSTVNSATAGRFRR